MRDHLVETITSLSNFVDELRKNKLETKRIDLSINFLEGLRGRRDRGDPPKDGSPTWRTHREIVEADELITIYGYLQGNMATIDRKLWAHIMEQPSDPWEETNAFPRSFQYELWLTGWLHNAGVAASWYGKNTDPDCRFHFGGEEILMEAKRPVTRQSVGNAIERARRQLSPRLRKGPSFFGLIAISLSVPILQNLKEEANRRGEEVLPAGNREALAKHGLNFIGSLLPELSDHFQRVADTDRILGVLFTSTFAGVELRPEREKDGVAFNQVGTLVEMTQEPRLQQLTTDLLERMVAVDSRARMPDDFVLGAGEWLARMANPNMRK